jgi:hypothetical protein
MTQKMGQNQIKIVERVVVQKFCKDLRDKYSQTDIDWLPIVEEHPSLHKKAVSLGVKLEQIDSRQKIDSGYQINSGDKLDKSSSSEKSESLSIIHSHCKNCLALAKFLLQ